jgi:hypothetical protein
MTITHPRRRARAALALIGLALVAATGVASADSSHHATQPLVVRGVDTVADGPCDAGVCHMQLTDATFHGTIGSGAYIGAVDVRVADAFPNGEGGVCAPISSTITLGAGSPDRLTLAVAGDSCQDGAGPVTAASFTGLARFTVVHGTGVYAHATGRGRASFLEDANDRDRMTLIGRIAR